ALAAHAAWCLAGVLTQPAVESALREFPLDVRQRAAPGLDYIWEPFGELPSSALPVLAGRMAYLIKTGPVPPTPREIDPRVAIPVWAVESAEHLRPELLARVLTDPKMFEAGAAQLGTPEDALSRAITAGYRSLDYHRDTRDARFSPPT